MQTNSSGADCNIFILWVVTNGHGYVSYLVQKFN